MKRLEEKKKKAEQKYVKAYPPRTEKSRELAKGKGKPKELPLGYREPNKWETLPPITDIIPKKKKEDDESPSLHDTLLVDLGSLPHSGHVRPPMSASSDNRPSSSLKDST